MATYEMIGSSEERARWLKLRRTGIGGSDAPAILGLCSWASPSSIQADKWGLLDEPADAEILRWGRRLEAAIIQGVSDEIGIEFHPFGMLLRSIVYPFMLCTPDAHSDDGYWAQVKNTMLADEWSDGPPKRVWVQCQHEMSVTGASQIIAAALLFGNRLVWQPLERDDAFINDVLIPAEEHFWNLTEAHEPYPPDGSEHTRRALQAIYPEDSGATVTLDGEFTALDNARLLLLDEKKKVEEKIAEIDNRFRHAIKDATFAMLQNGVRYSLKTQTRKAYTVKESTFRVLRRLKEKT